MSISRRIAVIAIVMLVAAASFTLTWASRAVATAPYSASTQPTDPLGDWLNLPASSRQSVESHDRTFTADLVKLRQNLQANRDALATALQSATSSDDDIRGHVEEMIVAYTTLERRVTNHLLLVRDHLAPDQRKALFDMAAQGVRAGGGYRRRGGADTSSGPASRGRGYGYRGGRVD